MNKHKNQHLADIFHPLHDHCYGQAITIVTYMTSVLHHLVQTVMFLLLKIQFLMSNAKKENLQIFTLVGVFIIICF